MRPGVVAREQEAAREGTLHGDGKSLVAATVLVAAPAHHAEIRIRTDPGERVDNVHFGERQQVGALTPYVRYGPYKISGQGLLHGYSPLSDVGVCAPPVIVTRRYDPGGIRQKRSARIGEIWDCLIA